MMIAILFLLLTDMAIGEFAQVVGTAVIIVIIISALNFYGSHNL